MKRFFFPAVAALIFAAAMPTAWAQDNYDPLHSLTGYNYIIRGTLELDFTSTVIFKTEDKKMEREYHLVAPVAIFFNRNDLIFFKAQPAEFRGYVENQFINLTDGNGGLVSTLNSLLQEEGQWMSLNMHYKITEDGRVSEIRAHGELAPVVEIYFSVPDFQEKAGKSLSELQFRMMIAGLSDPRDLLRRNVTIDYSSSTPLSENASDESDDEQDELYRELLKVDPALAEEIRQGRNMMKEAGATSPELLSLEMFCGTFYGFDINDALLANGLIDAEGARRDSFEHLFEMNYYKSLPKTDMLPLINFLIHPTGSYAIPVSGSFHSDSGTGYENATWKGTLSINGKEISRYD